MFTMRKKLRLGGTNTVDALLECSQPELSCFAVQGEVSYVGLIDLNSEDRLEN